ncbi:MAG TPA: LacI family DNA-binding transcriptional regulator, partial [Capsulimonadaceae bacterium]|nr:LacI family DNA-binding transcriptional regulator [Capsulimonadaceae bacterium]
MAQRARVSPITVSRVFSPRPNFPIAAATRERVHAAARELGYRPNRLARALVTGRTHVVTLHVPELTPYYAQIIRSTHAHLMHDHYEMIMLIDPFRVRGPGMVPERRPFPSDGVLAVDMPGRMDTLRQTDGKDTALVTMGTHPLEETDYVIVDLHAGARKALRHLIEEGAKRIGYVVWDFLNEPGNARQDAYEAVMRESGLTPLYYPVSWPSREAARKELAPQFLANPLPDALFCFNDDLAIGVFNVLRE